MHKIWLAVLIALLSSLVPTTAEAGGPGRVLARSTAKALARRSSSRTAAALARDLRNHEMRRVIPLARPRTVFRYTSPAGAQSALKRGLPPLRHMTSRGGPGRPMSAAVAKRALGLRRLPGRRLTIRLPKGQPVIVNKVQAGGRGRGEIVSPLRVDGKRIARAVRVH
jgi:hypothetical protein